MACYSNDSLQQSHNTTLIGDYDFRRMIFVYKSQGLNCDHKRRMFCKFEIKRCIYTNSTCAQYTLVASHVDRLCGNMIR